MEIKLGNRVVKALKIVSDADHPHLHFDVGSDGVVVWTYNGASLILARAELSGDITPWQFMVDITVIPAAALSGNGSASFIVEEVASIRIIGHGAEIAAPLVQDNLNCKQAIKPINETRMADYSFEQLALFAKVGKVLKALPRIYQNGPDYGAIIKFYGNDSVIGYVMPYRWGNVLMGHELPSWVGV